jgi:4-amino-4-deoxy-L-arabinose transferase-like glycosyltransferase
LIAYAQYLGTGLWGDTAFGVRFLAPVISAMIGVLVLRFCSRACNAQAAFWLILALTATPLLSAGSVLMTIDPLSVLFWTAAMVQGWRAVQPEGRLREWAGVGLWIGLGLLSKYTALFQLACFALFLALWPAARRHWRRPGPYVALGIVLLCSLPVLVWNARHDWITLTHLHDRAGLHEAWRPTTRFLLDFTVAEVALLNPIFFGAMLGAAVAAWRRRRQQPLLLYLLCLGAPLFLGYWLYTLRARVQPNWIAPAVVPLFCMTAVHAHERWQAGARALKGWLIAGLAIGLTVVVILHDTRLIGRLTGYWLPPDRDPLRRVHGWPQTAAVVEAARTALAAEGQPAFVIGDHYGTTGLLSFYIPEARASVATQPLVYFHSSDRPLNQFYFWPGYQNRHGQNAIYVQQADHHEPIPAVLTNEFESVAYWGMRSVYYRNDMVRQVHLYACRNLR